MKMTIRKAAVLAAALCMMLGIMVLYAENTYAAEMITDVEVILKAPAAGSDSDTDPVVSVPDGAPYEVEAKGWIGLDGTQEPPTPFKCEAGQKYKMWITLKAGSSYDYSQDVTVKVTGGSLVQIVDIYNSDFSDYSALVINAEVTCAAAAKKANPLTVSGKTASVAYSKVKKAAQSLGVTKVLTISKAQGTKSFSKVSGNAKITINKSTGKVTVKKGLKKGFYKVTVKVTAAGNSTYKKRTKKATFTIKVK